MLHLIKLSVGTEDVSDLAAWQADRRGQGPDGLPRHVTRMWPKRAEEVLSGGSIYWVIKGVILCRQRVLRFDEVDRGDGIRRCAIICEPDLKRVAATPKRAFQGWRYLEPERAPPDLSSGDTADTPPEMAAELKRLGLL